MLLLLRDETLGFTTQNASFRLLTVAKREGKTSAMECLFIRQKGEYSHDFADNNLLVCCFRFGGFLAMQCWHAFELKEARDSFSFFQTNKHILSLDTVKVIISRRNVPRVFSPYRRFLILYFPPK